MNKVIRVLAITDNDLLTTYHTENRKKPYEEMNFIEMLVKPHKNEYEVRYIDVVDIDLNKYQQAFDTVFCPGMRTNLSEYVLAFEKLWNISTNSLYGEF